MFKTHLPEPLLLLGRQLALQGNYLKQMFKTRLLESRDLLGRQRIELDKVMLEIGLLVDPHSMDKIRPRI